jgi:S1-C subfamily serine protease
VRPLTQRERTAFGTTDGVYVAYVQHGSVSAEGGLPRDAVITKVGETIVQSVDEVLRALERAETEDTPALIRVQRRDGTSAFYEVPVPGA